jgi:esterase
LQAQPYKGPVLWVAGATSPYVQPEYAAAMRALFPRAQLVTIKGAGHWVHSEQPQVFLAILRRFLGL